jgi:hypothetical protein
VFAHEVVHITLSGTMFGGNEEWATGFYVGKMSADAAPPTQTYIDGVRDAWQTFFTTAANGISNYYTFTQAKATLLATDGKKDVGTDVQVAYPAAAVYGGGSGAPFPPQIALVATLIAGSGKGLAGKGRMYLPGVRFNLDANGYISNSDALAVATNLRLFVNAVNGLTAGSGNVVINASQGNASLLGINARNLPVNGIRVGNVFDTQRRRRNGLAESYQVSAAIV